MRRTHERHQASLGGLTGSDGSGRSLLALRHEARDGGEGGRVEGRLRWWMPPVRRRRGQWRQAAGTRAPTAVVRAGSLRIGLLLNGRTIMCMLNGRTVVRMLSDRTFVCMLSVVMRRRGQAPSMMIHDHSFALEVALRQTQHGSSHRPPNGDQGNKQQQQPGSKESHGFSLSQSVRSTDRGLGRVLRTGGVFAPRVPRRRIA